MPELNISSPEFVTNAPLTQVKRLGKIKLILKNQFKVF